MFAEDTFHDLYHQLASAWEAHQHLRGAHAPFEMLASSSTRLNEARLAMWDWRKQELGRAR